MDPKPPFLITPDWNYFNILITVIRKCSANHPHTQRPSRALQSLESVPCPSVSAVQGLETVQCKHEEKLCISGRVDSRKGVSKERLNIKGVTQAFKPGEALGCVFQRAHSAELCPALIPCPQRHANKISLLCGFLLLRISA